MKIITALSAISLTFLLIGCEAKNDTDWDNDGVENALDAEPRNSHVAQIVTKHYDYDLDGVIDRVDTGKFHAIGLFTYFEAFDINLNRPLQIIEYDFHLEPAQHFYLKYYNDSNNFGVYYGETIFTDGREFSFVEEMIAEYDDTGRIISVINTDNDDDHIRTYQYSDTIEMVIFDKFSDAIIDKTETITYYETDLIKSTEIHDIEHNQHHITEYQYDANSNIIKEQKVDFINESRNYTHTYQYDANNNLIKQETGSGSNGLINTLTTQKFDSNNNLIESSISYFDSNGEVDSTSRSLYQYNSDNELLKHEVFNNNVLTEVHETEYSDSGKITLSRDWKINRYEWLEVNTYDNEDNLLESVDTYSDFYDNSQEQEITSCEYSEPNTQTCTTENFDSNGQSEDANTTIEIRDEAGNLIKEEHDYNADGVLDVRITFEYSQPNYEHNPSAPFFMEYPTSQRYAWTDLLIVL